MKRFVSLCTLIVLVGLTNVTWAQTAYTKGDKQTSVTDGGTYFISGISQTSAECYLYDNGSQVKATSTLPSAGNAKYVWTLTASDDEWIITNVGTGQKMSLGSSNGSAVSMGSTGQTDTLSYAGGYWTILNTTSSQAVDVGYSGTDPTTWSGSSTPAGSRRLNIYLAEEATTQDVTYNIYDKTSNVLLGSTTVTEAIGSTPSFTLPSYVTADSGMPSTIVSGTTSYDVYTTAALPFEVTTDEQNPTYYNLKIRSSLYLSAASGAANVTLGSTAPTNDNMPSYMWYITGNWVDGFNIVGKAAGTKITSTSYSNGVAATMGSGTLYMLDTNGTNNYIFYVKGTSANYLSNYGGVSQTLLKHYATKNDAGNYFTFFKVEETVYTVSIVGADGALTYDSKDYADESTFTSYTKITADQCEAKSVAGYRAAVTVDGTTITVTYTEVNDYTLTVNAPAGQTVTVTAYDVEYTSGNSVTLNKGDNESALKVSYVDGYAPQITLDAASMTITVDFTAMPTHSVSDYTLAKVYPVQQDDEVGSASLDTSVENAYVLYNNVLDASFVKAGGALYFAGSRAMNLEGGNELFTIFTSSTDSINASDMTLTDLIAEEISAKTNAIKGSEHYAGKQIQATFTKSINDNPLQVIWRAVLRDGSHYLRTEMELTARDSIQLYQIIPMQYDVDVTAAGSVPKVVGNTHGAVIISNKIFAGLETPTAHNTAGGADATIGYELATTSTEGWTTATWSKAGNTTDSIPTRVNEVGYYYPNVYYHMADSITVTAGQRVITNFLYSGGNNRLVICGVDLLDKSGKVVASEYHKGYTGNAKDQNDYSIDIPYAGTFAPRYFVEFSDENNTSTGTITTSIYNKKEAAEATADIIPLRGEWRRNAWLPKGDDWKVSSVIGLIAQDANNTQQRRSFLAYSERERAVPYRAMPAYISWYELNINRNNAAAPSYSGNMTSDQCVDVLNNWYDNFWCKYNMTPKAFVWDDGWDEYGTWTFNCNFPNGFTPVDNIARKMGSGIGAWLGPVGGYGTSGDYRRAYWTNKGESMVLSNPNYYKVFKDAAYNLTKGYGYDFRFFKFDGISSAFSATGPSPDSDTGHENAEGIIRLERYVRENLKEDIFFNTTVGTWASPFWFHYTDAVWRQENDYGTTATGNSSDRENWITYRDRLVYQNFVQNSPICPINTLMTHGFILSSHGSVSTDMNYDAVVREMRCAFACGSGMVELYNDYALMNSIQNSKGESGMLWKELANCIKWQQANANVLMDVHWVGGSPWDGSAAHVYGWASWNEDKATLALRNGSTTTQTFKTTLRSALNIPSSSTAKVKLQKSFEDQATLEGWPDDAEIDIDDSLTLVLPSSTVYIFSTPVDVESIAYSDTITTVAEGETAHLNVSFTPADACTAELIWTSSDESIATVENGVVTAKKSGTVTITASTANGKVVTKNIVVTALPGVNVTYHYKFNDKVVYSTTTKMETGDAYPAKVSTPWGLTFVSSTVPTTVRKTDDGTDFYLNYKATSYPFTFSLTTDDADANWQTIKSNPADASNGCRYWTYDSTNGTSNVPTTQTAGETDSYMWKFVGNPFEGYTIYNKAAGSSMTGNLSGGYFKMVATDTPTTWNPYSSQQTGAGYFSLSADGTNYINTQNGYLKTWTAADGGSTEVSSMPIEIVSLPYSTEANPHYYVVQFYTGSHALADQGSGSKVLTADKDITATAQQWALIGSASGFVLKSADGNYLQYTSSRFYTTSTKADASTLLLAETGNTSATGCYELHVSGASNYMNQYGGTGVGVELGTWSYGDGNNPFYLISATMEEPTWSNDGVEKYYFLQFSNSGNVVAAQSTAANQNILTSKVDPIDQQMWKLMGSKDSLQMQNKSGLYAVMKNGTSGGSARLITSTTPDPKGFCLIQTTNSTYAPNPEIKWNGYDGTYQRINQNGGTSVGETLCLWSAGDAGNVIQFVDPDRYEYDDYKINGASSFSPEHPLTLWYTTSAPATGVSNAWMEYALPIGNGELGASLFGGAYKDEIQFNEKTLWEGSAQIGSQGYYRNFGSVFATSLDTDKFSFGSTYPVSNYVRFLDIENGVGGVNYTDAAGTTTYQRRYIASAPDQVVAAHYTAEGTNKMNMLFTMEPGTSIGAGDVSYSAGEATFSGAMTTVSYAARLKVVADEGATITTSDEGITVNNASEITLILKGATNFDGSVTDIDTYTSGTKDDVISSVQTAVEAAATKGWTSLYDAHVADFSSWMSRMSFSLNLTTPTIDTESLVKYYNNNNNGGTSTDNDVLFLEQLYFAYGRYLEIGSNRKPIAAPNNLQGIWNDKAEAPWHSDIHANINVQMNYWPAESTNLSELHLPFLNWTIKNAQGTIWQRAATNYGGASHGWTFFTENNIFGGMSTWGSNYYVANAWNTSHLWQHYRYTQDETFLAQAFPVMWSAAQFWMDRLIEDQGYDSSTSNSSYGGTAYSFAADGTYVAPNEYSPEQDAHNSENGTAHAQQLISYLLQNVKDANDILGQAVTGLSDDDLAKLDTYLTKIDKGLHTEEYTANSALNSGWTNPRNGVAQGDSILREWKYSPYDVSSDPSHRHLSHLMALFPLDQIDPDSRFFEPAVNSLKLRGDDATGWSLGWKVNLWARALDGDHAHTIIKNALKHSTSYSTNQYAGGIFYNLYDSHAPFQIDGNFGTCSGIAEILLQSQHDYIHILPALPSVWQQGSVKGMKAVGNFTVNEEWSEGKATKVTIISNAGHTLRVRYDGLDVSDAIVLVNDHPVTATQDGNIYTIPGVTKGSTVTLYFDKTPSLLGDANDSKEVTISDVVTESNYLLGKDYDTFNFLNADANQNGRVTIADIPATTKIILNGVTSNNVKGKRLTAGMKKEEGVQLTLQAQTDGMAAELQVTEGEYSALQFDLTLPEDCKLHSIQLPVTMQGFQSSYALSADGQTTRILIYNTIGNTISSGLSTITLGLSCVPESSTVSSAIISTAGGSDRQLSVVGMGEETAIDAVTIDASTILYDLSGRRITIAPHHGVYIKGGKKLVR